ncbi:hypothetical protein BH11PSE12_BH11PSE12_34930 [soil metagenome]
MKRILCTAAAIVISCAAFISAQAIAQVGFNIVIGNEPPPARYAVVPAPRRGYEWAPGYWNCNKAMTAGVSIAVDGSVAIVNRTTWPQLNCGQVDQARSGPPKPGVFLRAAG